ncbi:hypothetical protein RhiirA5_383157 [Rhizophagus irregularis]|uniref:DUF8211 domain-containing protein n=2 Tax=Rhizophagus irregularis TaxID=588596 RepID=A0A2N0NY47_9GLOM|nr:hypothetical protein RhiirA5_383157 [Rhizophagus irregularis]
MSSTPLIEIDWSSTSQHPYVQLGDPTQPENYSEDISYNTERPVILSAKDVLSLDIDDIYPYTHSTLHLEDNETEYIYDDEEEYFQQLLQANFNAEIEKVSVLRNDKPLIDDTPLTPIQEINPIPPLDTVPLLDNLLTVENINPIPLDTAPFLEMLPMETPAPVNNIVHHKSFHANIIYEKYNNNSRQKIFSNRLGISYTTRYEARNVDSILPPYKATGPMYTKIYENFFRTLSSNPHTAARQKAHFNRSCQRIFNDNKSTSGMALKLRHKIRLANRRKFLFYPYQKISARIPHLNFNIGLFKQSPTVPLFRFPYDRNCTLLHLPKDGIFPPHFTPALRSVVNNQDSDEEPLHIYFGVLQYVTGQKYLQVHNCRLPIERSSSIGPALQFVGGSCSMSRNS